jgi:nucleoid DNA-binding protein
MSKSKKEFITLLAAKMQTDESTAKLWIEAYSETLFDIFKTGEGVTIDGLGGFYLERG